MLERTEKRYIHVLIWWKDYFDFKIKHPKCITTASQCFLLGIMGKKREFLFVCLFEDAYNDNELSYNGGGWGLDET